MEPFLVCQTCYAVVLVESIDEHEGWHEDIRDFIRATANHEA